MINNPTGADLRAARESAGLSQSAAAALCHRALRGWQDAESGKRKRGDPDFGALPVDGAVYELLLLKTGQHPTLRVLPK